MPKKNFLWIREDFRMEDNPALYSISNFGQKIYAFFIYDEKKFKNRSAQQWWLYKTLVNFQNKLNNLGISFKIYAENEVQCIKKLIKSENIDKFYYNTIARPDELLIESEIEKNLTSHDINWKKFESNLLQDPFSVRKKDNTPFQVFTPYWRNAEEQYLKNKNFINKKIIYKKSVIKEDNNAVLNLILPKKKWFEKFEKFWTPGEEMAKTLLKSFIKKKIVEYGTNRDIPSVEGTSKLSPYLAFGEISSQTIFEECYKISQKKIGFRKYINEIGWREFAHHLINFFPQMQTGNLRRQFDKFNWVKDDAKLKKWKQGKTGYPIVDAGMRELHETGWMHNRVRMITASFLVKHLRINWKEGEKHFRDCLLDFNAPNNIAGWQWVAGCGADAAPYFRIFNPILQGEKFDSEGMYVKKWVKELNLIPKKYIHKPWEMPEDEQSLINFNLKKNYYAPIVNHAEARNSALEAFKNLKN